MTELTIEYYASLKEFSKKSSEIYKTNSLTVQELFEEVKKKYNIEVDEQHLRAAINDEFVTWDALIKSGDKVVFIPPVAGG